MDNIENIINMLEKEIRNSKKAVLSNNKIVDEIKCLDYILALKESLPSAIMEAGYIMSDKEKILSDAKEQAIAIEKRAENIANQMVRDTEIEKRAIAEADEIIEDAKGYANFIKNEVESDIDKLLAEAEDNLANILKNIRGCREELSFSREKK